MIVSYVLTQYTVKSTKFNLNPSEPLYTFNRDTEETYGVADRVHSFSLSCIVLPRVAQVIKNLPANARDARDWSSVSEMGRSPGNGMPLLHSCLENSMDSPWICPRVS